MNKPESFLELKEIAHSFAIPDRFELLDAFAEAARLTGSFDHIVLTADLNPQSLKWDMKLKSTGSFYLTEQGGPFDHNRSLTSDFIERFANDYKQAGFKLAYEHPCVAPSAHIPVLEKKGVISEQLYHTFNRVKEITTGALRGADISQASQGRKSAVDFPQAEILYQKARQEFEQLQRLIKGPGL